MIRMFPEYSNVNEWTVLDEMTIHAYDEEETPIEVVKVQIGTVYRYDVNFGWNFKASKTPIIRWITKKEYNYFSKENDTVVW